eukprot:COSAG01_NODE_44670_length_416_cov_4.230284_2_plen_72_part_01
MHGNMALYTDVRVRLAATQMDSRTHNKSEHACCSFDHSTLTVLGRRCVRCPTSKTAVGLEPAGLANQRRERS